MIAKCKLCGLFWDVLVLKETIGRAIFFYLPFTFLYYMNQLRWKDCYLWDYSTNNNMNSFLKKALPYFLLLLVFPCQVMADDTVRLGWYHSENLQNGEPDSPRKSGYAYELYQAISNYTGWKYDYVHDGKEELYARFNSGEIDIIAFIGSDPSRYLHGNSLRIVGSNQRDNIYICVREGADSLFTTFQDAFMRLRQDDTSFLRDIFRKYYSTVQHNELTESDRNWVAEHGELRIGFSKSYLPFCSINKDGDITGVLAEILIEWEKSLGIEHNLKITPVPFEHKNYPEMIAALEEGFVDAVFPMIDNVWYSEENHLMTSRPVVSSSIVAVYKPPFSEDKLKSIGMASSAMQYICASEYFPNSTKVVFANRDECLNSVLKGEIGSTLFNAPRAQEIQNTSKYSQLDFMPLGLIADYGFAVKKGNTELLGLLNHGITWLNPIEITEKLYEYSSSDNKQLSLKDFIYGNLRWITLLILILISVILGLLVLYLSRSRQRLRENELMNSELEKASQRQHAQIETISQLNMELTNNLHVFKSLSYIYNSLYYVSLTTGVSFKLNQSESNPIAVKYAETGDAREKFRQLCDRQVQPEYFDSVMEFTDLDTLPDRLADVNAISFTFRGVHDKWYRGRFVVATRDDEGHCTNVLWTITDVTKQWEADLGKQRIIDETRAANQAKTRFLHNMSHEIRTPLNAMFGFAQLLGLPEGTWSEEEREQYNQIIADSHSMLEMLINDIIDIADSEHGNFRVCISDVKLNDVCRNSLKSVEYRLPAGVEMRFTSELSDDFIIRSDGQRIQQVIVNYLTNACKHTVKGEIHLHCSNTERPGMYALSVTDTGCGIPDDKADIIFDRFSKLDDFVQGSGLGLSICKMISERLGGEVYLDKSYKGGARFVFVLPDVGLHNA